MNTSSDTAPVHVHTICTSKTHGPEAKLAKNHCVECGQPIKRHRVDPIWLVNGFGQTTYKCAECDATVERRSHNSYVHTKGIR